MTKTVRMGVDIGGTKIAFALVDQAGNILAHHRIPTPKSMIQSAMLDVIAQGIQDLATRSPSKLTQIGIGCPGYVNMNTGVVHAAVNLDWKDVPLRDEISNRLSDHYIVQIANDVNAQLLGEVRFGAAKALSDVVYIAIGTGFGGAALVNGELAYGGHFASMEIGHIPLDANGRVCTCGQVGCVEMYVSGIGLMCAYDAYQDQYLSSSLATMETPTTVDILEYMKKNDPLADIIRCEVVDWLVRTLMICDRMLNPQSVIIGGGLGAALYPLIVDDVRASYNKTMLDNSFPADAIVEAQISDTAIGATCLFEELISQ